MTEKEWLTFPCSVPMLNFLGRRVTERKTRLFAAACCRRVWHLLTDHRSRHAVEIAEQFADGMVNKEDLQTAWQDAKKAQPFDYSAIAASITAEEWADVMFMAADTADAVSNALAATSHTTKGAQPWARWWERLLISLRRSWRTKRKDAQIVQAGLVRDLFGNPFHPIALDPSWLSPKVKTHAKSIYDDRAFEKMPELAAALEEAGCSNAEILDHCRGPAGPHMRGCWVVDLVLGKD